MNAVRRTDLLKKAFLGRLPSILEGRTIAENMAVFDINKKTVAAPVSGSGVFSFKLPPPRENKNYNDDRDKYNDNAQQRPPREVLFYKRYGDAPVALKASERVVRSHLRYLEHFKPFRHGSVTKSTLYEFLFYMIVEKGKRESYTKRVIKSIMAYLKAGGANALEIPLTDESKDYVKQFRGMGGVRTSLFYKSMDALANETGDDHVKLLLSTARGKRTLVFTDEEEEHVIRYCTKTVRAAVEKYAAIAAVFNDDDDDGDNNSHRRRNRLNLTTTLSSSSLAASLSTSVEDRAFDLRIDIDTSVTAYATRRKQIDHERTAFEFAFAYLLGFLSGARVKSTVLKLSVADVDRLLAGGRLEVLTKGVFVNVFLPKDVLVGESNVFGKIVVPLRTDSGLYAAADTSDRNCTIDYTSAATKFFTKTPRQLELMLDRVYESLFANRKRTKGVRWHSQRRRYLGAVNTRYGTATASESVGHRDLFTTMTYINNSVHMEDVQRKAGHAITDRYKQIVLSDR